jgi:hypothetical protein
VYLPKNKSGAMRNVPNRLLSDVGAIGGGAYFTSIGVPDQATIGYF